MRSRAIVAADVAMVDCCCGAGLGRWGEVDFPERRRELKGFLIGEAWRFRCCGLFLSRLVLDEYISQLLLAPPAPLTSKEEPPSLLFSPEGLNDCL